MNRSMSSMAIVSVGIAAISLLSACGVSKLTKERVARSESAVQQAQQTIGNSEAGAVDLQEARGQLSEARRAADAGNSKQAERAATQAQLSAELAVAKSQSAGARKAADELQASIQQLRQEASRGTTPR